MFETRRCTNSTTRCTTYLVHTHQGTSTIPSSYLAFISAAYRGSSNSSNTRTMIGMPTPFASLTLCLVMADAFVVRVGKVTPADHARKRQESASSPLGADGRAVGAGGSLSQIDANAAAGAKKKIQLRVPSSQDYAAVGNRSTGALHVFKGLEVRVHLWYFHPPSDHRSKYFTAGDRSF